MVSATFWQALTQGAVGSHSCG